jgi:hypothetical protein
MKILATDGAAIWVNTRLRPSGDQSPLLTCELEPPAARGAARHAWTDERVLRRAMTMLERIGDRAGAVKLYEGFAARLRADLEVEPSAETNPLAASIRAR